MPSRIYFLYYLGEPVYIGHTQKMDARIYLHRWTNKIEFDRVTYFETSYHEGLKIEKYLIAVHKPKHNIKNDWPDFEIIEYKEKELV